MKIKWGFLIPMVMAILIGYLCGEIVYTQYKQNIPTFNETNQIYFLQQGVYSNQESLNNHTKELDQFLKIKENDKYYVYVAITKETENAQKIKEIYNKKGNDIYIKQINVTNPDFISMLVQYDKLIANTNNINQILSIEKSVLSTYEELILNYGN
ncbi:MAG: hypothetical protein GX861_03090 [Tenericutes bacterium]|jgi:hypothetical protein|nr:hypothetical protein [Mycoplasmatota bacterium]